MPNFHVHWLVALGAIEAAPALVRAGRSTYVAAGQEFRARVLRALREQLPERVAAAVEDAAGKWNKAIATNPDAVTCFSAYMLGACGPDLWTVPSPAGLLPATAGYLFNLGHYNRTHRQFQVSVARQVSRAADPPAQVEQAYFSGMATHLAADLVVHQLVNVMAGAYSLLEKRWINEQKKEGLGPVGRTMLYAAAGMSGYPSDLVQAIEREPRLSFQEEAADSGLKKLWSMHNKVEHYWDTWVRYRYLGDHGPVFEDGRDRSGKLTTLGLPTVEGLLRELKDPPSHVREYLARPETRYRIEKALCFPQLFCDRAAAPKGGLEPFIYDVVANGAYPVADVHPELATERKALGEGKGWGGGGTEASKLAFFTSAANEASSVPTSWNYLAYFVCPDLAKVKRHSAALFDHAALEEFVATATGVASRFVRDLGDAYDGARRPAPGAAPIRGPDDVHLGQLHGFWNLDTGHALGVRNLGNVSAGNAVTGLELAQVLGRAATGRIAVAGARPFLRGKASAAFTPRNDERGSARALLPELPEPTLGLNPSRRGQAGLFRDGRTGGAVARVPTVGLAGGPTVLVLSQERRVSLALRIELPSLGEHPANLGWFLHADAKRGLDDAVVQKAPSVIRGKPTAREMTEEWLEKARLVDGGAAEEGGRSEPLTRARPGVLAFGNALRLELPTGGPRHPKAPPFDLGRNFAIGTGRASVLHPVEAEGPFDPARQLAAYGEVSPTEQIFFSLFVVVRRADGKVVELISGEPIEKQEDYHRLRRIDAAGFVKIVLAYESAAAGVLHLETCWIDGLEVPVARA